MTPKTFIIEAGGNMADQSGEDGAPAAGPRAGRLRTARGEVPTPAFMPVATAGSVKTLGPDDLTALEPDAIIANALVLSLRPGEDVVGGAGGLGRWMGYGGTTFTDSGGFQIVRPRLRPELDDDGIGFQNPYDGSRVRVDPERIVRIQRALDCDVSMVLDDCAPWPYTRERLELGVKRTLEWAGRAMREWDRTVPASAGGPVGSTDSRAHANGTGRSGDGRLILAIVQGGDDDGLRERCARGLREMGFDGYGIGGLSIGEPREDMLRALSVTIRHLPPGAPRYLMGVGSPPEMLDALERGVDLFDSVYPTRNARHGTAFVRGGTMDLRRKRWANVPGPLVEGCACPACSRLSVGYLHHLFRVKEMSGMRLLSLHNLRFTLDLVRGMRESVMSGTFDTFAKEVREGWVRGKGEPGR